MNAALNVRGVGYEGVTALLLGTALLQAMASLAGGEFRANAVGAMVCLIAYLHYSWMTPGDAEQVLRLRLSDWFVTCPLLLVELFALSGQLDGRGAAVGHLVSAIVASGAMVLFGAAARTKGRIRPLPFAAGCAAFGLVVALTLAKSQRRHGLLLGVFGIWALYPVAFVLDHATALNALDGLSKAGLGLAAALLA